MQLSRNKQILITVVIAVALMAITVVVFLMCSTPSTQIDAGTTVSPSPTVTVSDEPSVKPSVAPSVAPSTSPTQPVTVTETQMIISKASGRTLTASSTDVTSKAYDFKVAQRWIVEITGSNAKIKSSLSNKYLAANGSSLALTDKADSTGTWVLEESDGGFKALKNASTNTYLLATDGETLTLGAKTTEAKGLWYLNDVYTRNIAKADASWLEGKFGVMTHLLPDASTFRKLAERHDAKAIVAQLKEIGADYYIISVGQVTGYYNTKNDVYSAMIDRGSKKRFTSEDIISEIATECKKAGIKVIAYIPQMASSNDYSAYNVERGVNSLPQLNMENAMLWAITLQNWADTYGELVDGWWMDGCYPLTQFNNNIALLYDNAFKHGNPNSIIAYNKDIYLGPYVECEEYTCGEINNPFGTDTPSINDKSEWLLPTASTAPKFETGTQWQMLTYIGKWWLDPEIRFTPDLWAELVNDITKNSGSICLDVAHDVNNGYKFTAEAMNVLRAIRDRIK